jgi:hypothetical protein
MEGLQANGTAERDAALVMLEQLRGTKTVTVGDAACGAKPCPRGRQRHRRGAPRGTRDIRSASGNGSASKNVLVG